MIQAKLKLDTIVQLQDSMSLTTGNLKRKNSSNFKDKFNDF